MAKIATHPQRFTHPEWKLANNTIFSNAEDDRARAERLRAESDRLINETQELADDTQNETTKRLDQRLDTVKHWKSELDHESGEVTKEIDKLLDYKQRLINAIEATNQPLEVAQQCLSYREKRKKIDLVHDEVQKNLFKDVEVITGVQCLLQRTLEECEEQIRLCRSANYYLAKDMRDKFAAINIDTICAEMNNSTYGIDLHNGAAKIEPNSTTPSDWQNFSEENILKATRQKNAAINLRSIIDGVLEQTQSDLQKQHDAVSASFRRRIIETHAAKKDAQQQLEKVEEEIACTESTIASLKQAIADKIPYQQVAETRLNERVARPNVDLCRDQPQYRLIGEVSQINDSVTRLQQTLAAAELQLKALIRNQLTLEEDIDVKSVTLQIDEGLCVPLRKTVNHVLY